MILVDANILIYAVNQDSPYHLAAKHWWEVALSGTEPMGLAWIVILAFLRITTHQRIMTNPMSQNEAIQIVDEWLAQPAVDLIYPGASHWNILQNLILHSGATGNLITDAHLAAIALETGAEICSADGDFNKFQGIKIHNPLK